MVRLHLVLFPLLAALHVPSAAAAQAPSDPELKALSEQVQRDGTRAGPALMKALARRTEPMERFALLMLLAQIHHEPALPEMAKMLEQAPDSLAWQRMFVFGKMGPAAVPTLVASIQSGSRNVRVNAVALLGWLSASQAVEPLSARFWREADPELQLRILQTLEGITPSVEEVLRFSREVAARGQGKPRDYAKDALDGGDGARAALEDYRAQKAIDGAAFRKEHRRLSKSAGKEGDYQRLALASAASDEADLQALRERILDRGSDEAFDDYVKISQIILMNRMLAKSK